MPVLLEPLIAVGLSALIGEVAATGAIFGIAGLTVSGLVTGAVVLGLVVGAEALLSKGRGRGGDYQQQLSQPGTVGSQSIGPRFHAAGQLRVGGVYHYRQVDSGFLLYGVVINCGPIDSLIAHLVDDELQVTQPATEAAYVPYGSAIVEPTQGMKYFQTMLLQWVNGAPRQVPGPFIPASRYEFINATPAGAVSRILRHRVGGGVGDSSSGLWTSGSGAPFFWDDGRLCRGLTCMYSEWIGNLVGLGATMASFLNVYPNRYPQQSFIIRGEPIFDPRDNAQSFDDVSTWKWSRNPALIWAWYWTHEDGGRLAFDEIDWDSVAQAATDCERDVPAYGGGTEPFALCDIQWNTSEARADVEARILAACDGVVFERNGRQAIWIIQDIEPTVTLTAVDIASLTWDANAGALDEANYIQASYAEPRAHYANMATISVTDDASIARVGERPATIPLPVVTGFNQAYRLTHRVLRRRNPPQFVTITGGPRMLRAAGEFIVRIEAPDYGVEGKFLVSDLVAVDANLSSATMRFKQIADDAFDDVVSPDDPVSPDLSDTSGVGAVVMLSPLDIPRNVSWDGTPTPYIVAFAWTFQVLNGAAVSGSTPIGTPTDTTLEFFVQSRPVNPATHLPLGDGTWSASGDGAVTWTNHIDQWTMMSPALLASHSYELRAWFRSAVTGQISAVLAGKFVDIPSGP